MAFCILYGSYSVGFVWYRMVLHSIRLTKDASTNNGYRKRISLKQNKHNIETEGKKNWATKELVLKKKLKM